MLPMRRSQIKITAPHKNEDEIENKVKYKNDILLLENTTTTDTNTNTPMVQTKVIATQASLAPIRLRQKVEKTKDKLTNKTLTQKLQEKMIPLFKEPFNLREQKILKSPKDNDVTTNLNDYINKYFNSKLSLAIQVQQRKIKIYYNNIWNKHTRKRIYKKNIKKLKLFNLLELLSLIEIKLININEKITKNLLNRPAASACGGSGAKDNWQNNLIKTELLKNIDLNKYILKRKLFYALLYFYKLEPKFKYKIKFKKYLLFFSIALQQTKYFINNKLNIINMNKKMEPINKYYNLRVSVISHIWKPISKSKQAKNNINLISDLTNNMVVKPKKKKNNKLASHSSHAPHKKIDLSNSKIILQLNDKIIIKYNNFYKRLNLLLYLKLMEKEIKIINYKNQILIKKIKLIIINKISYESIQKAFNKFNLNPKEYVQYIKSTYNAHREQKINKNNINKPLDTTQVSVSNSVSKKFNDIDINVVEKQTRSTTAVTVMRRRSRPVLKKNIKFNDIKDAIKLAKIIEMEKKNIYNFLNNNPYFKSLNPLLNYNFDNDYDSGSNYYSSFWNWVFDPKLVGKLKFQNKLNKKLSRTERKKIKKEIKKLNANTIQSKNKSQSQSQSQKDNLNLTGNNNLNSLKKNSATTKYLYDKPLNFFNNKPISYFMWNNLELKWIKKNKINLYKYISDIYNQYIKSKIFNKSITYDKNNTKALVNKNVKQLSNLKNKTVKGPIKLPYGKFKLPFNIKKINKNLIKNQLITKYLRPKLNKKQKKKIRNIDFWNKSFNFIQKEKKSNLPLEFIDYSVKFNDNNLINNNYYDQNKINILNSNSNNIEESKNYILRLQRLQLKNKDTIINYNYNSEVNLLSKEVSEPNLISLSYNEPKNKDKLLFLIKENKIKIKKTIKSMINKNIKFNWLKDTFFKYSPIKIKYLYPKKEIVHIKKNRLPNLNQYLKSMSIYNMNIKGTFVYFSKIIGFNFKTQNTINNNLIKEIYKILSYTFKSMFCLISKPVFIIKADKIVIQLFYFLMIPNFLKIKKFKINNIYRNFKYLYNNKLIYYPNIALDVEQLQNKKVLKNIYKNNMTANTTPIMRRRRISKKRYKKNIFNFKFNYYKKRALIKFYFFKIRKKVKLIYLSKFSLIDKYPNKFKILCDIFSKFLNKNIELDLIRLHYPYYDNNILVNLLAYMVNKLKIRLMTRNIFRKAVIRKLNKKFNPITITGKEKKKFTIIPTFLTGLKIKVAGRLMNYKTVPRRTVRNVQKGISSVGRVNYTDLARYTSKNKKGAFSITISSGQNFFV